jgi:hypothetical protein
MKKMEKVLLVILVVCLMLACVSCTENLRTRTYGGTSTVELDPGQKLVEVTWKETSLWYLTEPMEPGYEPKTKVFQEDSRFGIMEGKVIFHEKL